jgi:glycosyltransferase involved in cell wall biosynthesis
MRVLGISSYAGRGGAERSFALLLAHLRTEADPFALVIGDGPLAADLERQGVSARTAQRFNGRPTPVDVLRFTRLLYRELRREKPNVVWASGQKAALLAASACRLAGVPLVWHKVDFSWDRLTARPLALASSGMTAVSNAVVRPVGWLGQVRLLGVVAPPVGPDLRAKDGTWPTSPTIGTLGRLVPYKGHHTIIETAAILKEEFPDLQVIIAGGDVPQYSSYRAQLKTLAASLGLGGELKILGFIEDIASVLSSLTVFISATYRDEEGYGLEGRGRAIIEASWLGRPVVATESGGEPETVIAGVTGTLVEKADPPLLAEAVRPYLRDPALAASTGKRAEAFVKSAFPANRMGGVLLEHLGRVALKYPR